MFATRMFIDVSFVNISSTEMKCVNLETAEYVIFKILGEHMYILEINLNRVLNCN